MAALVAGIHVLDMRKIKVVDGRDFRREDGASRLLPGHDKKVTATPAFS